MINSHHSIDFKLYLKMKSIREVANLLETGSIKRKEKV